MPSWNADGAVGVMDLTLNAIDLREETMKKMMMLMWRYLFLN